MMPGYSLQEDMNDSVMWEILVAVLQKGWHHCWANSGNSGAL